jgi:hypothetical protein
MIDNRTTQAEKNERLAAVHRLLAEKFGRDHCCTADLGGILRVNGDTTVRFAHDGDYWDLRLAGGQFSLEKAA